MPKKLLSLRVLWLALLFLVAGGAGLAWGSWKNLCVACPSVAEIHTWEPQQTSKVYSMRGDLIAELGIERRTPVSIHALPGFVPQAFIAVEDNRFYSHPGYDVRGIARAAFRAATRRSFGGGGGSTLTQQLARQMFPTYLPSEKQMIRKLRELQVSLELEEAYTKDEILEAYMNQVNFDVGYGIQTASRNYFGKNASELNPAEAALLAAIVNRPRYYNPFRQPAHALGRRNFVLDRMAQVGFLDEAEAREWKEHPLPDENGAVASSDIAPYFVEWVRIEMENRYGNQLYTAGLRIFTTLDVPMQQAADASMKRGFEAIESRPGYPHPKYSEFEEAGQFAGARTPYVQGMFIALDPQTGAVRAMVGGRDFAHSRFNRATQALRQPGSAFKPFVYTAAISSGIPASHILVDAPVVMEQQTGEEWRPQNFTQEFGGAMTIREGLRRSINMIAIKLANDEVTMETVAQTANRMGLRTHIPRVPASAIGAADVYPIQIAEAYSAFATLGTKIRPFPILRVESAEGQVLWEPQPERTQVLDSLTARIMVSLLEDVVSHGTGYVPIRGSGVLPYSVPAAGKTGTTNNSTDVWFVGFTPNLQAAVWFGMDQPARIRNGATGGGDAAPVWADFMRRVYVGEEEDNGDTEPQGILPIPDPWPMLPGLITRRVDDKSGKLASAWCSPDNAYEELFIPGTEPTEVCDESGSSLFGTPRVRW
ncbi:MAG: PBP1A family penicillin-binding protein [Gemmatimonadota bacterium]